MLNVRDLRKQYASQGGRPGGGVFGATLTIGQGELFTLLGPSGCGKTTTLRSIAGLETPDTGHISLGDTVLFDADSGALVPLYDRDIGMVFQSYAIWPHMTVFENASYPLRVGRRKFGGADIRKRTANVLERVGLAEYIDRPATHLSGGQQQRLALARALAREPKLLLLDEPLSNLDAKLRDQMRHELKRLQRETGVTTIYVTHDQSEALAISDRIAVMEDGHIAQVGSPRDIYNRPTNEFVAGFIGRTNLIRGDLAAAVGGGALADVVTAAGPMRCLFPAAAAARKGLAVVVRPEHVAISKDSGADGDGNRLAGQVISEIYLGELMEYVVVTDAGTEMLVRTAPGKHIGVGDRVRLTFSPENTVAVAGAVAGA
jgi:iron(III) transport system ATP-binding protein